MKTACFLTLLFLIAFVFADPLGADVITLKNGDRLTGSIVKLDGKNLILKSEYAGQVTLPWDAVAEISPSGEPIYVGLKGGNLLTGALSLSGDSAEMKTGQTEPVVAQRETIEFIRSKEEQAAYDLEIDRFRNPRLVDLWTGYVDLGLSEARGNAVTSNITVNANATRATSRDRISTYFTSIYASSDTGNISVVTANALRGGIKYELNITPAVFTFGSTDLEFDEFQALDLRFAPAGGVGWHLWKTTRGLFDLTGGASLNREFFTQGLTRTSGEALLGQELQYQLGERTSLRQKLVLFPNLTDVNEYRMNFDFSAVSTLWRWLGWQFTISDRFISNPVEGRRKNDILYTTGLRLTFAR